MDFGSNLHVDDAAWNETLQIRVGVRAALGENQFAECVQMVIPRTGSTLSYEKSARVTEVVTDDPSTYGPVVTTRDACGDDSRATIRSGNPAGRAWGGYSDFVVEPGADGFACGRETSGYNNGSDQPLLDQVTSKYGHLIASKGAQPLTAALYALGCFHLGFAMRTDGFSGAPDDAFLAVYQEGTNSPVFRVDSRGALTHANGRRVLIRNLSGFDCLTLE